MITVPQNRLTAPKSPEEFEVLCKDLLNKVYSNTGFVLYGRSGQKQYGIDISSDTVDGRRIVAQCKNYHDDVNKFKSTIKKDIEDAKKIFSIDKYIIMTSLRNDTKMQDFISTLKKDYFFEIDAWFWDRINGEIWHHPDIFSQYYPDYYIPKNFPTKVEPFQIDSYITRNVVLASEPEQNQMIAIMLGNKNKITLSGIIAQEKKIILVGEAGGGKSIELQKLYNDFYSSENIFPIFLSLREKTMDYIVEILSIAGTPFCGDKIFIIDGLDEIEPDKRNIFFRQIMSSFPHGSDDYVVISSREHFAKDIDGFKQFRLSDLTQGEIKSFAESKVCYFKSFWACLVNSQCETLVCIPFYLKWLVKVFQETNTLPPKTELMKTIVELRISADIEKYDITTIELKRKKKAVEKHLCEVAFAMQLLKAYNLKDDEYQELFDEDDKVRDYFVRWGIIAERNYDGAAIWLFEHNNFREYLAAQYLMELGLDKTWDIITYDSERKKLRLSWVNVVAYLVSMFDDANSSSKLVNWLIDNDEECMYNLEKAQMPSDDRKTEIFTAFMDKSIDKRLYFHAFLSNEDKMYKFCECKSVIEYVKEILVVSQSEYAILNSLRALSSFNAFYGYENELQEIIISKYINNNANEYQIQCAIYALSNICRNNLHGMIERLFPFFEDTTNIRIMKSLIVLVNESKTADKYIDFILKASDKSLNRNNDLSLGMYLETALLSVKTYDGVSKVINYFSSEKYDGYYHYDKILTKNCTEAVNLYNNGNQEIFNVMFDVFLQVKYYWHFQSEQIKQFFVDTKTLERVLSLCFSKELPRDKMWWILRSLMDETLIDTLKSEWLKSDFHDDAVEDYIRGLNIESKEYERLSDFARAHKDREVKGVVVFDYDKVRKEGEQKYFDSLFNQDDFEKLLEELLVIADDKNITGEQIFEIDDESITGRELLNSRRLIPRDRKDLDILRFSLMHWCGDRMVKDYLKGTNWGYFSFVKICKAYSDYKELIVNDEQKEYMKSNAESLFDSIDFSECKDNSYYSIAHSLVVVITNFGGCCDDERLLKMLYLPYYLFHDNSSLYESALVDFIINKISDKQRLHSVLFESFKANPTQHIKNNFFAYCKIKNLPDAVNVAVEMLKSSDSQIGQHTLIEYLQSVKGNKYIDDEIVPCADSEMLLALSHQVEDNNENLLERLKTENEESKSRMQYLVYLIKHDTRYGLQKYLELTKVANAIPDKSDEGVICSITESIRDICNSNVLDIISELIVISQAPDFRDGDFGLKNSLGEALANISRNSSSDYEKVCCMLTDIRDGATNNDKLVSYCNWHIERLKREANIISDKPWKLKDVKRFLTQNS